MKKGPKDLKEGLPPLKYVADNWDRLPPYFDMMWDIKYGSQVFDNLYGILDKPHFYAALAEYGYDTEPVLRYARRKGYVTH